MSYALLYYFINVLERIGLTLFIVFLISSMFCIALFSIGVVEDNIKYRKTSIKLIPFAIILFLLIVFLPSKNTALIMSGLIVAGDNVEQTVNEAIKIPPKLLELINKELDLMNSDEKKE